MFGDSAGNVSFWKDTADDTNPASYLDNGQNIPTTIWTRSFQFGQLVNDKSAYNCTLRFTAGRATATIAAVMDLATTRSFAEQFAQTGDILGQATLPFQLASAVPFKVTKSLRSLPTFNEMYLSIQTTSGYIKLRTVTLAAFMEAYDT